MTDTKFGTFDELMDIAVPDMRPIARHLREIVNGVDPDTVEVVRLGDRAATYGVGPKKMSEGYAYILPHRNWVNLGFYMGVTLPRTRRDYWKARARNYAMSKCAQLKMLNDQRSARSSNTRLPSGNRR